MISAAREYQRLGDTDKERASAYRGLFKQKIDDQQSQEITEATLKGWVLGNARFVRKIETLSGRRGTQLPKGRPKGS